METLEIEEPDAGGPAEPSDHQREDLAVRVARPVLSGLALLTGVFLVWNLTLQYSHRTDHVLSRPARWELIAILTITCLSLCIARWVVRKRSAEGRLRTAIPTGLLVASFLTLVWYLADGVTLPCRSVTEEILWASTVLCVSALVTALILGATKVAVGSAGVLLVILLLTTPAYGYSCGVDKAAQSTLRNALFAAKVYFTDEDTYEGFTAEEGAAIEPSLVWTTWGEDFRGSGPPAVMFEVIDAETIIMVAYTDYGDPFCLVDNVYTGTTYGESGSNDPSLCTADSWYHSVPVGN